MPEVRILLVEDNAGDALLMKLALTEAGIVYTQTLLDDGAEALAHLSRLSSNSRAELPHLILLDLNLPKVTGMDILRGIRASAALDRIPVVVLSASESPRNKDAAFALGVEAFLIKPSDLTGVHEMGRKIRDVLERLAARPTAE